MGTEADADGAGAGAGVAAVGVGSGGNGEGSRITGVARLKGASTRRGLGFCASNVGEVTVAPYSTSQPFAWRSGL